MVDKYPWYEFVKDRSIEQGDLLFQFPILEPIDHTKLNVEETPDSRVVEHDVVVMTQSCDLANQKLEEIILCPHFDISEHADITTSTGKNKFKNISTGRIVRFSMLNKIDTDEFQMNHRIVDFGRIFTTSRNLVEKIVEDQKVRLRLCPPYREHLAQGFARFFMRVGLPQDIEFPES